MRLSKETQVGSVKSGTLLEEIGNDSIFTCYFGWAKH